MTQPRGFGYMQTPPERDRNRIGKPVPDNALAAAALIASMAR